VGFFIANLRSFFCDSFKVLFFLWGNGSPNWRRELDFYLLEEANSWSSAVSKPGRKTFDEAVKSPPRSGANAGSLGPATFPSCSGAALGFPSHCFSLRRRPWFFFLCFGHGSGHATDNGLQPLPCYWSLASQLQRPNTLPRVPKTRACCRCL